MDILAHIGDEAVAVLSSDPYTYIQCASESADKYIVEFQEGSLHEHYRSAELLAPDTVRGVFLRYLHGERSWRSDFQWEMIPREALGSNPVGARAEIRIDPATGEAMRFSGGLPRAPHAGTWQGLLKNVAALFGFALILLGPMGIAIHYHREDLLDRYFPYFIWALGALVGCPVIYLLVKNKQWQALTSFTAAALALWLFPTFAIGSIVVLAFLVIAIVAVSKWHRIILPLVGCYIVLHFIVKYW